MRLTLAFLVATALAATFGCRSANQQTSAPDAGGDAGSDVGSDAKEDAKPDANSAAGFARLIFPILQQTGCGECHNPGQRLMSHWTLTTPAETYDQWVNVPGFNHCSEFGEPINVPEPDQIRVIPRDPDGSLVMKKLTATWKMCGIFYGHMPPAPRTRLTPEQLGLLRAWIAAGAPP